ncbi:hypothetical protein [Candidatus Palauibacter sp.]|uniref:hypothetical protein n=1 Tax=Candidatus Palauibacter sp. TaxID=3101350 RepID=UPI003B599A96
MILRLAAAGALAGGALACAAGDESPPESREAIDAVLDGTARGDDLGDGEIEYVFEGFSLLLRAESP